MASGETTLAKRDRWLYFLFVTLLLNLVALILFPMFLTDKLTPQLASICGVPAAWGLYILLCFNTRRERIVGYVGISGIILWTAALVSLVSQYGWGSR